MRRLAASVTLLTALLPAQASAQTANDEGVVVINGQRVNRQGKPIPMSGWRVAESEHVLVYSKGDVERLTRIAHNLERLHFLLSMLLDRVDRPDDALKVRVTLIGDAADFDDLNLTNARWQQGPYPPAFPTALYYDPREDGAVIATTYEDQKILLQRSFYSPSTSISPTAEGSPVPLTIGAPAGPLDFGSALAGEKAIRMTAEGRIYAAFAQHYLMTYFPAAYPRWYLTGFGEIFSTIEAERGKDGILEFGQQPEGFGQVMERYGRFKIAQILDGSYLQADRRLHWTPYHAWALAHLLFFSDEWKVPLHNYLAAVARGAPPAEAAKQLGDLNKLQKQLATYHGRKVPNNRITYPPDRARTPLVRRLTRSEAVLLTGKLELGARLAIPDGPPKKRAAAIARRDSWIAKQRETALKFPDDLDLQLLVADAECRSGDTAACLAVAERVLAQAPEHPAALAWKGIALAQLAIAGPGADRAAKLRDARALIIRANRLDTESVLPLLGYYHSFVDAGERPPESAVLGLLKAFQGVPSSPSTRLLLAEELVRRGNAAGARKMLTPIADGPFDTPEKARAAALLASIAH